MFLIEPAATQADLNFRLGSIPVRISPWFWLMAVLLGRPFESTPKELLIWVFAVLVSILVHELGHAGMALWLYGCRVRVLLYHLGGLAFHTPTHADHRKELAVLFAGPGAGFVLAGILIAALLASGKTLVWGDPRLLEFYLQADLRDVNDNLDRLVNQLLFINVLWGLVNLLPVFPLDGGQIARILFMQRRPHDGMRQSLVLSIAVGVGVAALAFVQFGNLFVGLMFGSLAYTSYAMLRMLQQYGGYGGGGGFGGGDGGSWRGDSDDDWRGNKW